MLLVLFPADEASSMQVCQLPDLANRVDEPALPNLARARGRWRAAGPINLVYYCGKCSGLASSASSSIT